MEDKYNIDDFYKNKFDGFESEPSLESFEITLIKLQAAQKKRRRKMLVLLSSGFSLLALFFCIGHLFFVPLKINTTTLSHTTTTESNLILNSTNKKEIKMNASLNAHIKQNRKQMVDPVTVTERNLTSNKRKTLNLIPQAKLIKAHSKKSNFSNPLPAGVANSLYGTSKTTALTDSALGVVQKNELTIIKLPENSAEEIYFMDRIKTLPTTEKERDVFAPFNDVENVLNNQVLPLKTMNNRVTFFVGLSYLPLLYNYSYTKTTITSNTFKTGYNSAFNNTYVTNINKQKTYNATAIPAIKFGMCVHNKWDFALSIGYYKLHTKETVYFPPIDTSKTTSGPITTTPYTIQPPPFSNDSAILYVNQQNTENITFKNEFRYVFAAIEVNRIINFRYFMFKPGVAIAFNNVLKSSYVLVDNTGYTFQEKQKKYLNAYSYNISFKAGLAKQLMRKIELQLNPTFVFSPTSVFDKRYFLSQKMYGFGLEAAVIFKL
jgi:hypothetical protein